MAIKAAVVSIPHNSQPQVKGAARALLDQHPLQRLPSPSRGASATVHCIPLLSLAYSYWYLHAFPSPVNQSYGWHLQYLTIIGLTFTLITFIVAFLADVTLSRKLFALKNGLSVASAPLECLITILYWSIRAIDPKLLEQSWADPMPLLVDMTFHLFPALGLVTDLLFFSPPYTIAFLPALGLSGVIASGYWIWIEECYRHNNYYPYPLFELLSPAQRALLFGSSAVIMTFATVSLVWLYKAVNPPPPKKGTGNIEFARSGNVKGE